MQIFEHVAAESNPFGISEEAHIVVVQKIFAIGLQSSYDARELGLCSRSGYEYVTVVMLKLPKVDLLQIATLVYPGEWEVA